VTRLGRRRAIRAAVLTPLFVAGALWWYLPGSGTVVQRYSSTRPSTHAPWTVVVDPDRWGPTRIMHPSSADYLSCKVGTRWPDCKHPRGDGR
jgi:hypothetical protein